MHARTTEIHEHPGLAPVVLFSWNLGDLLRSTRVKRQKLFAYIQRIHADILCLQEYPDAHVTLEELQHAANVSRVVPKGNGRHALSNDTVLLSNYPIVEQGEIVHGPDLPLTSWHRASSWATYQIGPRRLRVYGCHFEITGCGFMERRAMLERVIAHADTAGMPTVICGDMNTTIPKAGVGRRIVQHIHEIPSRALLVDGVLVREDERVGFAALAASHGFQEVFDLAQSTWVLPRTTWEVLGLKLDWFLVRGIEAEPVAVGPYITDHRPLFVRCWV